MLKEEEENWLTPGELEAALGNTQTLPNNPNL